MRPMLAFAVTTLLLVGVVGYAQEDPQVAEAIKQEIIKRTRVTGTPIQDSKIRVTATPFQDPSLAACFTAAFYRVTIEEDKESGAIFGSVVVYMKTEKGFEDAFIPWTGEELSALQRVISPKFVLTNDATGLAMLAALNRLYSEQRGFGKKFEPMVVHNRETWKFILDECIGEKFRGFVLRTDAQGRITNAWYSLGITK